MVARGLSEAKPLWRPAGRIEGGRANASRRRMAKAYVGRRPAGGRCPLWRPERGWREGGREGGGDSRGKRVRGGERRERDDCLPEASRRVKVAVGRRPTGGRDERCD